MSDTSTQDKWNRIYSETREQQVPPMRVVAENLHLLPPSGKGLELACGLAANSFALAEKGIEMDAWDISNVAADSVNRRAVQERASVTGEARDVVACPPDEESYDVIVVTHFLDRSIAQTILDSLKPGGLLFYQTYTQTYVTLSGPKKAEWRLADGELLSMFSPLRPLVYREEGVTGDTSCGFRNQALLVAQKPK
ncbi:class I SAM-dependent methyltransferase [Pseudomonadota bacterium]